MKRLFRIWAPFLLKKSYYILMSWIQMFIINQTVDVIEIIFTTNYYNITITS